MSEKTGVTTTKSKANGTEGFDRRPIKDVRRLRRRTGMNQLEFWDLFGVTQSGGSRHENGRKMSKPLTALIRVRYPKIR